MPKYADGPDDRHSDRSPTLTDLPVEWAAGGVVWREGREGAEVLLVHRPKYGDWTFPKGKLEQHESLLECARREVFEEAGVDTAIGRYLGRSSYRKRTGRPKEVDYWVMRAEGVSFVPSAEVDRIRWVAKRYLTDQVAYETERKLVAGLGKGWRGPADRILLTRHARAGVRGRWQGDDSTRPLSERGRLQAEAIVDQLQGFHIDTILTSRATRCRETVTPLADARHLVPEVSRRLWEEAGGAELDALLGGRPAGTSLLCSHRPNVKTALRKLMGGRSDLPFAKGSTWVFDFVGRELAAANYLAAPA